MLHKANYYRREIFLPRGDNDYHLDRSRVTVLDLHLSDGWTRPENRIIGESQGDKSGDYLALSPNGTSITISVSGDRSRVSISM